MATLSRLLPIVCLACSSACGKPTGLGGPVTPLAQIHVQTTGDLAPPPIDGGVLDAGVAGPPLRVALVWGLQWLPEPFCLLPPESPEAAQVIAAGCPDSFGFVADRVGADVAIQPDVPTTIDLISLPGADVMVGDLTARIAYASIVVYQDRNGDGVLDLRHPPQQRRRGESPSDASGPPDIVYGASFVSMTAPDQRIAFREGGFNPSLAFYPRVGCPDPPAGFSILSAGGFSPQEALTSALVGQLPAENPASCGTAGLEQTILVALQASTDLRQLACTANDSGGVTYYREAPANPPSLVGRAWACTGFPHLPGDTAAPPAGQQLVVAGAADQPCRYTFHYTLRGCGNDPACATPNWDITGTPPTWWPCLVSP